MAGGYPAYFRFEHDYEGARKVLRDVVARAKDLRPWFRQLGKVYFQSIEQAQFDTEGAFGGVAGLWAVPYSQRYARDKEARVGHQKKEILTGRMMSSLVSHRPSMTRYLVAKNAMEWGSQVGVSSQHIRMYMGTQFGWQYPIVQQKGAKTTRYGHHVEGARERRPSEGGKTKWKSGGRGRPPGKERITGYKRHVPPRPPLPPTVPRRIMSAMSVSFQIYIVHGVMAPIVPPTR